MMKRLTNIARAILLRLAMIYIGFAAVEIIAGLDKGLKIGSLTMTIMWTTPPLAVIWVIGALVAVDIKHQREELRRLSVEYSAPAPGKINWLMLGQWLAIGIFGGGMYICQYVLSVSLVVVTLGTGIAATLIVLIRFGPVDTQNSARRQ